MNRAFVSILAMAAVGLIGLMFSAPAMAADYGACNADVAKFCGKAGADRESVLKCLEAHETELSDICKEQETRIGGRRVESKENREAAQKMTEACKADVDKYCGKVNPAKGGMEKCLKAQGKKVSKSCRKAMKMVDEEKSKMK
ncbi:MAG: hypothetical protein PHY31_04750 [Smithellaceae bacterium]|nr:hypothetical protein [Smithellaceae bacterium]